MGSLQPIESRQEQGVTEHLAPEPTAGTLPRLAVVICTHDRTADTLECLTALVPQLADTATALVVVDSASSPDEAAALRQAMAGFPAARLIRVDEPGLSLARNIGTAATGAEWVAFLDDDAVPHPDWHARLLQVLERMPADCGAIGGKLLPLFPPAMAAAGTVPQLGRRWKMYVSINDAEEERDCTERFGLIAANCVFRRAALDQAGGFPLHLGRVGRALLSGEDVMLMRTLRAAGWRIRYHSQFAAGHKVSAERLTRRWVRSRAYWEGITTLRMKRLEREGGQLRLIAKVLAGLPVTALLWLLRPQSEWDFRCCYNWGVVAEAMGLSPSAKRK